MEKYSTAKKRIIKYSCVVGLISFMLLFLVGCMILGYMEKEEKSGAAYMAQSTVRRIKAQLEQYVVSSDLVENIIQTGYQLDEETFSNLASVIPNENGIIKAFELAPDGIITDVYPNPDKPEKLFLFSTPCVILKKKGVFICYSLINTLIKFMASLPVMTA